MLEMRANFQVVVNKTLVKRVAFSCIIWHKANAMIHLLKAKNTTVVIICESGLLTITLYIWVMTLIMN